MTFACDKKTIAILTLGVLVLFTSSGGQSRSERGTLFNSPRATIYYEVLGSGPNLPLMVVHGGTPYGHVYLHYSRAVDSLAKDRRIVYYDQRGRALSPELKPGQSCTIADSVADLEALRAHLGIERMDLLGHSFGGFVLLAFAARHPEHVNRMILVGSPPPRGADLDPSPPALREMFPEASERGARLEAALKSGDRSAWAALVRDFAAMTIYSRKKRDEFLARLLPAPEYVFRRDPDELMLEDARRLDLTGEVERFQIRTLILNGRYDPITPPGLAFRIQKVIPGSHVVIFERSGHFPFFEEPDAFAREVRAFLR